MTAPLTRRSLFAFGAAGGAALLLAACSTQGQAATGGSGGKPVFGGTLNVYEAVTFGAWQITNTLWSNSQVTPQLADRLTWQDPSTGKISPWLATSWDVNDAQTEYTFHLRKGVTFSDGTKLDAAAVKANYDQHGLGDESKGIVPDQFFINYKEARVVDDHTVTIVLTKPDAGFLQVTSIYRTGILAASTLAKDWNAQGQIENLVGSGPFVYESGDGVSAVVLKRRDDYDWAPDAFGHTGKAYLEKISYKVVAEQSTRVGALTSGQAHIARGILPDDEATVTGAGSVVKSYGVQGETNHLKVSLATDPTSDKAVRQALQAATNRKEIRDTALSDSYGIAKGLLVKGTPGFVDASDSLGYDLAKAKQLLDDAGWKVGSDGVRTKGGEKLAFTAYVAPFYPVSQQVLELLQAQWKKAGVAITLKSPSLTQYTSIVDESVPVQQAQWSRADADVLYTSFSSSLGNAVYEKIPELDALAAAPSSATTDAERQRAVQAISDYVFDNALAIPLYDETQVFGLQPKVNGFRTEAVARQVHYDTWIGA